MISAMIRSMGLATKVLTKPSEEICNRKNQNVFSMPAQPREMTNPLTRSLNALPGRVKALVTVWVKKVMAAVGPHCQKTRGRVLLFC